MSDHFVGYKSWQSFLFQQLIILLDTSPGRAYGLFQQVPSLVGYISTPPPPPPQGGGGAALF